MTRDECLKSLITASLTIQKVVENLDSEFRTPESLRISELEREVGDWKRRYREETHKLGWIIEEWRLKYEKLEHELQKGRPLV